MEINPGASCIQKVIQTLKGSNTDCQHLSRGCHLCACFLWLVEIICLKCGNVTTAYFIISPLTLLLLLLQAAAQSTRPPPAWRTSHVTAPPPPAAAALRGHPAPPWRPHRRPTRIPLARRGHPARRSPFCSPTGLPGKATAPTCLSSVSLRSTLIMGCPLTL